MGTEGDREHFEDYRDQTRVKHEILEAYLPAYFNILKRWDKNLLFIDGFAGRGTYTKEDTQETFDGSPLRALKLIASKPAFAEKVSAIFVEADEELFPQLEQCVEQFYKTNKHMREPTCLHGTFTECVAEILEEVKGKLAPAFLFVDPCGVSGTSLHTISSVMDRDKCEAFIFFNIDGVRRTAGLSELSEVLVDLMGSKDRAKALYDRLKKTADVHRREELILSNYREALNSIGAKYTTAFRIEHEDKKKTSHYLIHATKHPLGFKIMKEVMWSRGRSENKRGGLEFAQASRTVFAPLFGPLYDIKNDILNAVKTGPRCVGLFYDEWVERPEDAYSRSAYKQALLELESDGDIEVLDKDGKTPKPASMRKRHKGEPTLGDGYYVRLAKNR